MTTRKPKPARGGARPGSGPKRRVGQFRQPLGSQWILQRQSVDLSTDTRELVTLLNGDGGEIEFQAANGDILSIIAPDA